MLLTFSGCRQSGNAPGQEAINAIKLKKGDIVLCGPADKQFGTVRFQNSCGEKVKDDFDLAIALLHSFEYDEAEKVFAKIIDEEPGCPMAYWGVAMSNFHQVWPSPPTPEEIEKGGKAILIAQSLVQESGREKDYIDAMALFYKDWRLPDHCTRSRSFAEAMGSVYEKYPDDREAGIFYALSLDGSANPSDKSYVNQRKAGKILEALYPDEPGHPGVVHYIIHSYDYPELASLALPAARKYASIAPASAHAQHMPSHVFTRLGLWDECIQSNLVSIDAAKCYAEGAGINGHWDEELHGMDYLVYAYLQTGQNKLAKQQYDYLESIKDVYPVNFKVAYAFAAIPSRYLLENKMWTEAAGLQIHPSDFPWQDFPWQEAIFHYARLLGSVHMGSTDKARTELQVLNNKREALIRLKDDYKANQVMIQVKTGEAWILYKEGKKEAGLALMEQAAKLEDMTERSPVTPGEVLPANELLADMLMSMGRPAEALEYYEAALKTHPNRFNGLYGAGLACEKSGNPGSAKLFYGQLISQSDSSDFERLELEKARQFIREKH
jgi:tetratricopeptide (TPR) repeat protein